MEGHTPTWKSALPPDVEHSVLVAYRSAGLGVFGAIARYAGMPLEKIALVMNSSQVSGSGQLGQAFRITFKDGALAPYRVVGRASFVAWFMQYSVMGFVFQTCDSLLAKAMGVPRVLYGEELMLSKEQREERRANAAVAAAAAATDGGAKAAAAAADASRLPPRGLSVYKEGEGSSSAPAAGASVAVATVASLPMLMAAKALLAPVLAGSIESVVANRAEAQRYYGITQVRDGRWRPLDAWPLGACPLDAWPLYAWPLDAFAPRASLSLSLSCTTAWHWTDRPRWCRRAGPLRRCR